MTLAARCPACGTVFRVVQDQLRVSEGWVRCGRCAEVFNAIETLVEVDTELPPRDPAKDLRTGRVLADLQRVAKASAVMPPAPAHWSASLPPSPLPAPPPPPPRLTPPPPPPPPRPPPPPAAPPMVAESTVVAAMSLAAAAAEAPPAPPAGPPAPAEPTPMPTFVRQAERAARWRRPGVRLALGGAAAVLAVALALQWALEYRDFAAARWPGARPLLQGLCGTLGCTLQPPRQIESLAVDSSGLVRVEGTAMYKLSVTLKNRAHLPLAVPALDLTLTDSQGGVIARRVVRMTDLGHAQAEVPPASTLPLQATLAGPDKVVSGYTIELFYP